MKIKAAYNGLIEDPKKENIPRQAPGVHYSLVLPEQVPSPKLLCWSSELGNLMGIPNNEDWLLALSGNKVMMGMKPLATRYGGHQFGHWAGQLGDGRAITLGLVENEGINFELQLKGAGLTPYSRSADGKAVLRSSLREFICSESMAALGVPTTRALSLVETGEKVVRDMFYDGNPESEPGAICSRVAPTFLRFGHFQIHAANGEKEELKKLIDFTLDNFYPKGSLNEFFLDVVNKTAFLITEWYRVGFVHGVMNTDNMSILGLTIDYGPYGWLDVFDPDWTPNTTDFSQRRYRFMNQHNIAFWNLARLAEALEVTGVSLKSEIERFPELFKHHFSNMMTKKLGLKNYDDEFVNMTFNYLVDYKGDMTLFYRTLLMSLEGESFDWQDCFYKDLTNSDKSTLDNWYKRWQGLVSDDASTIMAQANPVFVPRNYIVQEVLDSLGKGDDQPLRLLEKVMMKPYAWDEETKAFFKKRPDWAATKPGCSTLSCSS